MNQAILWREVSLRRDAARPKKSMLSRYIQYIDIYIYNSWCICANVLMCLHLYSEYVTVTLSPLHERVCASTRQCDPMCVHCEHELVLFRSVCIHHRTHNMCGVCSKMQDTCNNWVFNEAIVCVLSVL